MSNAFRDRLLKGDRLIGTIISLPAPELAEIASQAGFDWLFLDMEHGPLEPAAQKRRPDRLFRHERPHSRSDLRRGRIRGPGKEHARRVDDLDGVAGSSFALHALDRAGEDPRMLAQQRLLAPALQPDFRVRRHRRAHSKGCLILPCPARVTPARQCEFPSRGPHAKLRAYPPSADRAG